jgi:N-acetylglucosaminyldiphosphoundecaprenol N-acetyl-beta-D-mannosaminyltransferase
VLSPKLKDSKPDIILVAFGSPAQEFWIDTFKVDLEHTKIAVGIGGTFDFWTGKTTRAPKAFRSLGLEWLWRLLTQPKRAKRIYNAVVVYSGLVLKEKFSKSH